MIEKLTISNPEDDHIEIALAVNELIGAHNSQQEMLQKMAAALRLSILKGSDYLHPDKLLAVIEGLLIK